MIINLRAILLNHLMIKQWLSPAKVWFLKRIKCWYRKLKCPLLTTKSLLFDHDGYECESYIVKPFDKNLLIVTLKQLVSLNGEAIKYLSIVRIWGSFIVGAPSTELWPRARGVYMYFVCTVFKQFARIRVYITLDLVL